MRKLLTEFPLEEAKRLYEDGLTLQKVADAIGWSKASVGNAFNDAGIRKPAKYNEDGERLCSRCKRYKTEDAYPTMTRRGVVKLRECCRDCFNLSKRVSLKSNPGDPLWKRDRHLKDKYGISHQQYMDLLEDQGGGCKICCTPYIVGERYFPVDHDHSCCPNIKTCGNCIRGILCGECNKGLGAFKDNKALLDSAKSYLDSPAVRVLES